MYLTFMAPNFILEIRTKIKYGYIAWCTTNVHGLVWDPEVIGAVQCDH